MESDLRMVRFGIDRAGAHRNADDWFPRGEGALNDAGVAVGEDNGDRRVRCQWVETRVRTLVPRVLRPCSTAKGLLKTNEKRGYIYIPIR